MTAVDPPIGSTITRITDSQWHRYRADTVVYVCYWEGTFYVNLPPPPPGCVVKDMTQPRQIVVIDPSDPLRLEWAQGTDDQLPIQRPAPNGVAWRHFDVAAPVKGPVSPPDWYSCLPD